MDIQRQLTLASAAPGIAYPGVSSSDTAAGELACACGNRKFSKQAARCGECAGALLAEVERRVALGIDGGLAGIVAEFDARRRAER